MSYFNHNWIEQIGNTNVHLDDNRVLIVNTRKMQGSLYMTSVRFDDQDVPTYSYADDLYDAWDRHNEVVELIAYSRPVQFMYESEPTYSPYVRSSWVNNL